MCFNQTGDISTLNGSSLKLVDKFTYLGSSVLLTETDINTRLAKAWTAVDRLSVIWKSDLTDKGKRSFFQTAIVSILLYGYTSWTLSKRMEKKLDGYYTKMLRAILNKSWKQHPTKQQMYGYLPPPPSRKLSKLDELGMQNTAGEVGTYFSGPFHMDEQRQDVLLEPTYNSSVQIQDVALKTSRRRWTIERGCEKGLAISMLMAQPDDDDDETSHHPDFLQFVWLYFIAYQILKVI